jgi:hypothetical protein
MGEWGLPRFLPVFFAVLTLPRRSVFCGALYPKSPKGQGETPFSKQILFIGKRCLLQPFPVAIVFYCCYNVPKQRRRKLPK